MSAGALSSQFLPSESRPRWIALLVCAAVPLAFGVLAIVLGQDADWDLRNYHWYNPYAFLTGRWNTDLGAGSLYNPLPDVPFYLAAQVLPARVLAFLLGTVQGLNYILLFALGRAVLAPLRDPLRMYAAVVLAVAGLIGGGHIALVGTVFNDNVVSLAILGAMLLVIRRPVFSGAAVPAYTTVALSGLLMGIGAGLKLPAIVFAVGLCLAFLVTAGPVWRRLFLSFWFGIGVLAGIGVSSGFWMWRLWETYGNPFFPYFNTFFASPMLLAQNYRDTRFIPDSLLEALVFPIVFSLHPDHVGEIPFRDFRILAAYAVLLATPFVILARRKRAAASVVDPLVDPLATRYLIAACVISFVVWTPLFAIYRYIIPLEMLAPLVMAAAIGLWPLPGRLRIAAVAALLAAVTVTVQPGTWIRRETWSARAVEVTPPPIPDPAHSLVVLVGIEPLSYVIPELPPEMPVLRLQGYLTDPADGDTGMNRLLRRRLDAHAGPIYLLVAAWEQDTAARALAFFGLAVDFAACAPVQSNLKPLPDPSEDIALCPVGRLLSPAAAPQHKEAGEIHP